MKMSAQRPNFNKAFSICFANRNLLKRGIDDIDYELSDSGKDNITPWDLFRGETGKRCVLLLVLQMKYQIELYRQIKSGEQHNVDLHVQMLLIDCSMPRNSLKVMDNHHKEPRVEDHEETTYAYFDDADIRINCESLVRFVDKFLNFIIEQFKYHTNECLALPTESCIICSSRKDMEEQIEEVTPLLEGFGIFSNDIPDKLETVKVESTPQSSATDKTNISIKFDDTMKAPTLQEEPNYERFSDIVVNKYKILGKYYSDGNVSENDKQHPFLLLYCDKNRVVKAVGCNSVNEALKQASTLCDISENPFPVVFIASTDERKKASSPSVPKRMVKKCGSKIGTEDSPSQVATLMVPEGREPFEVQLLFYLDTGADSGSVGFNLHIIRHFVLTVENINDKLKPAIICEIRVGNHVDADIHVFDVDEHPNWNAISLAVLKKYRMYIDFKNNKVELGRHENVAEVETKDSLQVTFKRDSQMSSLSVESNREDL